MAEKSQRVPRAGTVALTHPGYYLGDEMAPSKYAEMLEHLRRLDLEIVPVASVVSETTSARGAGEQLAGARVDFICAVLTTFVPDHYIVELLDTCDVPIFLWAVEREIDCISLVGGLLINPTLYELGKDYELYAADIGDSETTQKLMVFARAAMTRQVLRNMRVGYMSANPNVMFSMVADEYGLKRVMGTTVVQLRDFDYLQYQGIISDDDARADWEAVKKSVGKVEVAEHDGLAASKAFLALKQMAEEMRLDALSVNCLKDLKSKICLAMARLNDGGIGAACEGDLYSTTIMRLLYVLSNRSALNGDFLRLFPEKNQIMFSHCGAGPFSMARSEKDIILHQSIETHDGLAVFFPADQPGTVTALNLMGSRAGFRMAALVGQVQETDMLYEGNPMRVKFEKPVHEILQAAVKNGAGHHWNISYGDFSRDFELLCDFLGIQFNLLSK